MFSAGAKKPVQVRDVEDAAFNGRKPLTPVVNVPVVNKRKRNVEDDSEAMDMTKSWREALGNPPSRLQSIFINKYD